MKLFAASICALALALPLVLHAQEPADPNQWLETIDSPQAMDWVKGQNARTSERLEKDARYQTFFDQARAIFTAEDRIPLPNFRAGGVENLWQDAGHVHGLLRRASLASYRTAAPAWDVLLDLDKLSADEHRNWFWKGADCLRPAQSVCLARLSDGGGDAVEVREFDAAAKRFVPGGFDLPNGKQTALWLGPDRIVVARAWTPDEVTASGYPYVIKILTRGGEAKEVFRGQKSDVSDEPIVLHGAAGDVDGLIARRSIDYYHLEYSLLGDGGQVRIPLPPKAQYDAYVAGQLVFTLKEPWRGFGAGAVISYDLQALKRNAAAATPSLVFAPGPRQAVQEVGDSHDRLIVQYIQDVQGAADAYAWANGRWARTPMQLPKGFTVAVRDASATDDEVFFTLEGFLKPTSLWLADAKTGRAAEVKSLPPRFDASRDVVEQYWATSADGTKIPYFVVRPKTAPLDGSTPTLMFGYGGFEIAETPAYKPELGKLWLERGGAYVVANIRGGGEFGPAWHEAALREHRQRAFDDFAAVAKDLAARKITSARRLGIYGRSNGGVLTTVSMTQHPELWHAIVIESPLIDMLRYSHLSAGASWIGEYGDPDVPGDRAFIAKYSGYQNLKTGVSYPEPYITTNTRDDRVHPGHARKFAAKMAELGYPYLYYEQTFGGHANDADPELNARRWARHYVYLSQKLMD
jgi:prolyl oligopeptidase